MERGPPDAFLYLGPGPTDGRRHGPAPRVWVWFCFGFWFWFGNHIGPDRFRHALKNAYWAPSMVLCGCGKEWRGRDRRKLSFNDEKIPRLTSRSCGEFPCIGRTLLSRHLRGPACEGRSDRAVLAGRIGNLNRPSHGRSRFFPKALHPAAFGARLRTLTGITRCSLRLGPRGGLSRDGAKRHA